MSNIDSLKNVLLNAQPPYTEVATRLLFCTSITAGKWQYRIREIEMYSQEDPYTHEGDEQVSTTAGWYFHRTKPGGGWKGGTFMGLDISFAPEGIAGGVLIRGISRIDDDGEYRYIDGSCNCVRELLRACDVSNIKELVGKSNFRLDALDSDGILRLTEHKPKCIINSKGKDEEMRWIATSRVGLSNPSKKPQQEESRQKFHKAPLRFLQIPFDTKKEKTNIKNATVTGVFTLKEFENTNGKVSDGDSNGGKKKRKRLVIDDDDSDDEKNGHQNEENEEIESSCLKVTVAEKTQTTLPSYQSATKKVKNDGEIKKDTNNLELEPLFAGKHGLTWKEILTQVIESLPEAADFIGPNRSKDILPLREMTFRSIMALPPEENNLVVFGMAPYPRIESASGIAMFDTLIKDWDCKQFGKTVSMRCIAKAAAVAKGAVKQEATIGDIRKIFKKKNIVSPPEWFQAMLAQGVLLLNASLTIGGSATAARHTKFWIPVMQTIIDKILQAKTNNFAPGAPKRRIGFLWWGREALKTKKALTPIFVKYENKVEITHIEHFNPAAQGDKFCQLPNHFKKVNKLLVKGNLEPIDWLPNKDWLKENHIDSHAAFITETQELHKIYLDRLQAGLDTAELTPITGIMKLKIFSLLDVCADINLENVALSASSTVDAMVDVKLNRDEMGAIYLYTTNVLYRRLNEALRNPDRSKICIYFKYLRLFLEAYIKMEVKKPPILYRGINKDLGSLYKEGTNITWWTISSCTPNVSVARSFGGGSSNGTLFHVQTDSAVPIMHLSAYKFEEEYVLAPGTVLKVDKITKMVNQATQIYLTEISGRRSVT